MLKKIITILLCVTLLMACNPVSETDNSITDNTNLSSIIYVDADNKTSGDGTSWESAYSNLQDALSIAENDSEIWVAEGTYYASETDSSVSFVMIDDVDVYGGFKGTELTRDERNWESNTTILSGEIGDNSTTADNTNNIVLAADAILDGFTIQNGYSMPGPPSDTEGGQPPTDGQAPGGDTSDGQAPGGDASVGHMTPQSILSGDASTTSNGSAIVIWEVAPQIQNCTIIDNSAAKGGAIYIVNTGELEDKPLFTNTYFGNNYALGRGGAISIDMHAEAVFIDCVFENNVCDGKGGAIYNDFGGSPLFENCLFIDNTAPSGAALGNDGESNPVISNSTFYGNTALEVGAALYQGSGPYNDPVVINSIIWNNFCEEDVASVYNWNESNTKIDCSIVEGGYVGEGILDADPMFENPENMNFNLQDSSVALTAGSEGGRIGYDASVHENRSVSEYESIIDSLYDIEGNEEPIAIDLSNPKLNEDISFVGETIYVTTDGNGNGENWENSMASLQDAVDYANAKYVATGQSVDIYVNEGTYYTGEVRSDSFVLREGVSLYGGFDGTETSLDERDYSANETILSGDIGVRDEATDNSYHVVIGSSNAILDGFTITGGQADKEDDGEVYDNKGGGLLNYNAGNRVVPHYTPVLGFDTIIRNSTFENNYAIEGAASYTFHGGNPVFENCSFENNEALYGGAILDRAGTNSTYVNSTFENNVAEFKGGAAFIDYGSMTTFTNCEFDGNASGTAGGAIYVIDRASQAIPNDTDFDLVDPTWTSLDDIFSTIFIENSIFTNNSAGTNGGSIYVYESSFAKIISTEFSGNNAGDNGDDIGIFYESTLYLDTDSEFESSTLDSVYIEDGSTLINE